MNIRRATLKTCGIATDTVVVIDVLRAFTTAAYAFSAGAKELILVSSIEEAFMLKETMPQVHLMGEENGLPIRGFDFGNSPSELVGKDLCEMVLVQRTSAGTQGVAKTKQAKRTLTTGLCNATATVNYLKRFQIDELLLVETGVSDDGGGADDVVCADFIEALILNRTIDENEIVQRVRQAPASLKFTDKSLDAFPLDDLECAVQIDRFDFVMEVTRVNGLNVLRKVTR